MVRRWALHSTEVSADGSIPRGVIHFLDSAHGGLPCGTSFEGMHQWDMALTEIPINAFYEATICETCYLTRAGRSKRGSGDR